MFSWKSLFNISHFCFICDSSFNQIYEKEICMECQTHSIDFSGNSIVYIYKDIDLFKITFGETISRTLSTFQEVFLIYDYPCYNYLDPTGLLRVIGLQDKPPHKYIEWFKRKFR